MDDEADFPPELDHVHEVIAVLSEPHHDVGQLAGIVAAAISAYARRVGESPQTVAEELFKDLPGGDEWERKGLPELDAYVAAIIEKYQGR